jgi:hypothetical protein
VDGRLGELLREDQKPRFEELKKRWEKHHRRVWGGGPPPAPAPAE